MKKPDLPGVVGPLSHPAWPDYLLAFEHLTGRSPRMISPEGPIQPDCETPTSAPGTGWAVAMPTGPMRWRQSAAQRMLSSAEAWCQQTAVPLPWPTEVRVAWKLLCDHPTRELDLGSIARHLGVRPAALGERFREITGGTFRQFLGEERTALAIRLMLEQPRLQMAEIAQHVSGQSMSQFNRNFRQATGSSPRAFRDQWRDTGQPPT
ncbi:hypothetical protein HAHE_26920 [Haloferula helveola]|uniref:HTH araC/xylS-type domain-containing protein n=1 Tax=Haloferula helveola TaxID=490095 RepID=A0ABM7RLU6_9BACT|nr:hypothetical protein HAHE_26920 [Haloferula helveola]